MSAWPKQAAIGIGIASLTVATWTVDARAAELAWLAPDECPEQASIETDLQELIGQTITEAPAVRFVAKVDKLADGTWRAELSTTGRSPGTRTLTGPSCAEVSRAAVVAMALVVNSDREQQASEPKPKQDGQPATPAEQDAQPEADDPPEQSAPIPVHPLVSLGAVLDGTALPNYAFGVSVAAGLSVGSFRALLGGLFLPPVETRQNGSGAQFSLLAGSIVGCYRIPIQSWATLLCGRYELGALRAKGVDISQSRPETIRWNAVAAEAIVSLPLAATTELGLGVGAVAPLERAKFVLDSAEPVHELPGVGPRIQAGVTVIF